jgi:hypothetical protein
MAIETIDTALRNDLVDAFVDAIDQGAGAGTIEFHTTAFGALLATLTFADPSFNAAATGSTSLAASIIGDASADAGGTVDKFRVKDSNSLVLFEGDADASGGDIVFNTALWVAGDAIDVTAINVIMPAA